MWRACQLGLLVAWLAAPAVGFDPVQVYADLCYKKRATALAAADAKVAEQARYLASAEADRSRSPSASVKPNREALAAAKKAAEAIRYPLNTWYYTGSIGDLKVGAATRLSAKLRVVDVIDSEQMLVRAGASRVVWLIDPSAGKRADQELVPLDGLYTCRQTRSYENALGTTATVFVVQKVDFDFPDDELRFTRWRDAKTWTSTAGTTLEAVFHGYERSRVLLVTKDNEVKRVKLTDLVKADRDFVMEWRAEKKAKQEASSRDGYGGRGGRAGRSGFGF
ncbi:MAG: hypothetical protein AAGJ46_15480 [Planctomycetota bacterium]